MSNAQFKDTNETRLALLEKTCSHIYESLERMEKENKESFAELKNQIQKLESQLTGNMFTDMEIKDKIHNLKMKINGSKPSSSEIDCVGCGS